MRGRIIGIEAVNGIHTCDIDIRPPAFAEMADQAAFRGRICDNSWAYRCSECHRSQECWAFSQNATELPNRRDKRSAMAGDIARRSLKISLMV